MQSIKNFIQGNTENELDKVREKTRQKLEDLYSMHNGKIAKKVILFREIERLEDHLKDRTVKRVKKSRRRRKRMSLEMKCLTQV